MKKILTTEALVDSNMAGYMWSKKIMETNSEKSIMEELQKRVDADKNDKCRIWICYFLIFL